MCAYGISLFRGICCKLVSVVIIFHMNSGGVAQSSIRSINDIGLGKSITFRYSFPIRGNGVGGLGVGIGYGVLVYIAVM